MYEIKSRRLHSQKVARESTDIDHIGNLEDLHSSVHRLKMWKSYSSH